MDCTPALLQPSDAATSPGRVAPAQRPFTLWTRRRLPAAPVTATVLTRNSERLISEVLAALHWCDEIIVFDTGSTDRTLALASAFSRVRVHSLIGGFPGFGRARQEAVALARNDWILSVDSDEIISDELAAEIAGLPLDPNCVYTVPFENYFNGKHITTCGWAPDRHERLFHRQMTGFCESAVHERVQSDGLHVVALRQPIRHYSYHSPADFLAKMAVYSQLFANQHAGKRRSGPGKASLRAVWAFLKSYVLERGLLQGFEGLVISAYKAQTVFWKYVMLHQANGPNG